MTVVSHAPCAIRWILRLAVLAYTAYSWHVFRGKVRQSDRYY